MGPAVRCESLSVQRGSVAALHQVDLDFTAGEVTVVVGPNGAGKSTLIDAISGALAPASGRVETLGLDPLRHRTELATRWSVMPQTGGLPMGVTVTEAVTLFADLWPKRADVDAVIETVGLTRERNRPWRRLSGGQQQRLSLAVTLVGGHELLILDEPTAAVDPAGRDQLLALLAGRAAEGSTVIVTTHEIDVVATIADRAVLLLDGRVVSAGSVEELCAASGIDVISDQDLAPVAQLLGCTVSGPAPHWRLDLEPSPENLAAVAANAATSGTPIQSVGAASTTLEDWYRRAVQAA